MRLFILLVLCGLTSYSTYAQCLEDSLNMELAFNYDDPTQPGIYNDVWGYVDDAGREYAIIGSNDSILIFDVTDTENVVKVGGLHGDGSCSWRDMKTWRNTLYAGSECGDGLLIFDLSDLPNSFSRINQITTEFTTSHNIYIDSTNSARLYAVGANGGLGEGMAIYDLEANETDPPLLKELRLDTLPGEVASGPSYYIHDIFVKNDTAYCSHGNTGYAIWDISDVENINRVSDFLPLPIVDNQSYTHSSWNTSDDKYAYVATEVGNRQIYIIDQEDKTDISLVGTWKEPLLESCGGASNNVPHNPYIIDDILYISYYQDGVNMLDISDRLNPVRIGFYDTEPNNSVYNGTTANWGVYPFLPSGTIIGSDTGNGLFVLEYNPPTVPLELLSFSVDYNTQEKFATLSWEITDALNVSRFVIEKQINGRFEEVGSIPFASKDSYYEFDDYALFAGANIYRIKILDLDRSYNYSPIKQIFVSTQDEVVLYPSVHSGVFTVDLSMDKGQYLIYNLEGKMVKQGILSSGPQEIVLDNEPSGQYIFQVNTISGVSQSRFVIAR